MKIEVYPFAYHKILGGQRKIDIRPYSKRMQSLQVGDMIEYVDVETKASLIREVKGIALFRDFETMIRMLPSELIGYTTPEEVRVRVERMYPKNEEFEYGVCALFIEAPEAARLLRINSMQRSA